MTTFYVVSTPIGNLEDITLRAVKVLSSVDLVLCEDTRVTKKLFAAHGINVPAISYHAHSSLSRTKEIISLLKQGKNLALVSDAGVPGISDPGSELVSRIREEMTEEIKLGELKIESVPGPSALTAAISIAGVPSADFVFLGFLPHKKGRETLFKEIAKSERTIIFYESPHRILKTLESLNLHLKLSDDELDQKTDAESERTAKGNFSHKVTVCRELTKIFEEVVSGNPADVRDYFSLNLDKVRGEFVILVSRQ